MPWYLELMSPMGHWSPQLWTDRPSVQTIHGTDYLRSPGGHSPRVRAVQEVPDHLAGAGLKAVQAALSPDRVEVEILDTNSPYAPDPCEDVAHPDDYAVACFAVYMKAKLARKRAEGRGGWEGPTCTAAYLSQLLREHVAKGDPVDVANLAMMLHQRGERIEPGSGDLANGMRAAADLFRGGDLWEEAGVRQWILAAAEKEARHG